MIFTALTLLPCNKITYNILSEHVHIKTTILCKVFQIDQAVLPSIDNALTLLAFPDQSMMYAYESVNRIHIYIPHAVGTISQKDHLEHENKLLWNHHLNYDHFQQS